MVSAHRARKAIEGGTQKGRPETERPKRDGVVRLRAQLDEADPEGLETGADGAEFLSRPGRPQSLPFLRAWSSRSSMCADMSR